MLIRVELFLLVIKGIILNNVQSSNHKGVISVYSGEYILESQEILLEKYGFNSHLDEKSFRLSGKLCSFDQNNDIFKQCFGKYELLNKRWILMISSKRHLEIVSQYLRNIDYEAVLFLKSAVNVNYTLDFIHPYFSLEADQYESFQKYDINSETENLFTYISYDQLTHEYAHMKWLNGVSLALLVIISLHFVLWVLYTHYLNRGNYTLLQRYYGTLPYMNLMLVSGVYYYVVNKINERVVLDNLFFLLVTEILIKLVKIIYKTFFWILVILVSYVILIHLGIPYDEYDRAAGLLLHLYDRILRIPHRSHLQSDHPS